MLCRLHRVRNHGHCSFLASELYQQPFTTSQSIQLGRHAAAAPMSRMSGQVVQDYLVRRTTRLHSVLFCLLFTLHRSATSLASEEIRSLGVITDRRLTFESHVAALKPRLHQQQCRSNVRFCRSNIRLCRKNRSTCSIRQCCFDIVAGVDGA